MLRFDVSLHVVGVPIAPAVAAAAEVVHDGEKEDDDLEDAPGSAGPVLDGADPQERHRGEDDAEDDPDEVDRTEETREPEQQGGQAGEEQGDNEDDQRHTLNK